MEKDYLLEICKVLEQLISIDKEEICIDTNLREIGIDSLLMVEMLLCIEEKFDIILDETNVDLSEIITIMDIVNIVKS